MKKGLDRILLTPHELEIMKIVWDLGTASVKNVHAILVKRKRIAYTTVLTIMSILESKGVLIHTKSGRAFIYRPILSRKRAMHNQVTDIIERFFDGNPQKLIEAVKEDRLFEFTLREEALREKHEVSL